MASPLENSKTGSGPAWDGSKEAGPSEPKRTILIVDDDPDVRAVTSSMLEQAGYRVIHAASGPDAFEKIVHLGCSVDLLLTDLIMPGMTGRAVADTLLAWCPAVQVVFMSGHLQNSQVENMNSRHEDLHYLQKPFDRKKLMAMVNSLLKK